MKTYEEIKDDLRRGAINGALAMRARKAIEELQTIHELDQVEIVNLRRQIEAMQMKEEEKLHDLKEGNRSPYKA